jgi:hypothetical protein
MVKPIGIVAMLILLASGPALADHHVPIRAISDIKVTNTNQVHFELKDGNTVIGDLPNCDVMQFVEQVGDNNLGLFTRAVRSIREGSRIVFLNLDEKRIRSKAIGSCEISNIGDKNDFNLLAKN